MNRNGTFRSGTVRALHAGPVADPGAEVQRRLDFLQGYARHARARALVLGVSGGQDSSLTGRLCQLAAERLRAAGHPCECVALRLPYGAQADEADAARALGFIRPDRVLTVNIRSGVDALAAELGAALGTELGDFHRGNLKARARMAALYAVAGPLGGLVVGTDHAAEALTGFFTKHGDGAADVMPLAGLSKRGGAALLRELGAPAALWEKVPTADLEDAAPLRPDEAALGVSYRAIDDHLEGGTVSEEDTRRIAALYRASEHKRRLPVTPFDGWWREPD